MSDFTHLIEAAQAGDRKAAADLLPLVYDELRQLAAAKMAGESSGHTFDATALVHEAYLRLTGKHSFESRSHFMRAAAEAMRRILVDHARQRNTAKRGGGVRVLSLDSDEAESRYRMEPAAAATPETLYERRWALMVIDRVLERTFCTDQMRDDDSIERLADLVI